MGWETREQTCPHEWGHGSLEGCSTVWVTGEKTKNQGGRKAQDSGVGAGGALRERGARRKDRSA
jgi:hypothetical protein